MKVLHVGKFYSPHRGGIETYLQLLCEETRGVVDIDVVVSSEDRNEFHETINGVRVRRLPTWMTFASASVGPGLIRAIRESTADIVHIHVPHPIALLAWLASRHPGRLVISYHSDIVRQRILGTVIGPLQELAISRAAAIIATSPNYVESSPVLRKHQDRCVVIPFGIRVDDFRSAPTNEVERIRDGRDLPIVLAVGRLVTYKGFEYLVSAMKDVAARLILIGDGPLRNYLSDQARRHGVDGRISFVHEAEDLRAYYWAADLFVLPSVTRAEAFGVVQLEAMACAKPVVNTFLDSGVNYVSPGGQTGLTVPARDPVALAGAINRLLSDPNLRAESGAAALRRVEDNFTVDKMARRTIELYERVLSRL
jgi:rhamnosyl/mannosyltransferase